MLFPHLEGQVVYRCGEPAWRRTCKQNIFCDGVV